MDGYILILTSKSSVPDNTDVTQELGRAVEYSGIYPTYKAAFLAFVKLIEDMGEHEENIMRLYFKSLFKLDRKKMDKILEKYNYKIIHTF